MRFPKTRSTEVQFCLSSQGIGRADIAIAPAPAVPLCVDLNGTLVRSDLLLELLLLLIKGNALYLFLIPIWFARGKSVLRAEVTSRVTPNPETLPYDREIIGWLESEYRVGRKLWLCAAGYERVATGVASHLGLFAGVLESGTNDDLLDAEEGLTRAPVLRTPPRPAICLMAITRGLRPHQWAKNVLILLPMLAAHRVRDLATLSAGALAFVTFCFCASSVYVLNDLLDLEADRAHPRKRRRPFAAGDASLRIGMILVPSLLLISVILAGYLPKYFQLALAGYYALTVAYSFRLKRIVVVDTVTLAGLYTLRVIAGAFAEGVPLSFWLLLLSIFLFLSLAFVKRFAELDSQRRQEQLRTVGRGYDIEDLPALQSLGCAAGYLSVLILALYINSPEIEALYRKPKMIWVLCVLLLCWITRVWMKAQRGTMHDDPVVFALKDRASLALGGLAALTVVFAI